MSKLGENGFNAALLALQEENVALKQQIEALSATGKTQLEEQPPAMEVETMLELLQEAENEADHWRQKYKTTVCENEKSRGSSSSSPSSNRISQAASIDADTMHASSDYIQQILRATSRAEVIEAATALGSLLGCKLDTPPLPSEPFAPVIAEDLHQTPPTLEGRSTSELLTLIGALERNALDAKRLAASTKAAHVAKSSNQRIWWCYFTKWNRFVAAKRSQRSFVTRNRDLLSQWMQEHNQNARQLRAFHAWRAFVTLKHHGRVVESLLTKASALTVSLGGRMKEHLASCEDLALDVNEVLAAHTNVWCELRLEEKNNIT